MCGVGLSEPLTQHRQHGSLVIEQGPANADVVQKDADAVANDEQDRQHHDCQQDNDQGEFDKVFAAAVRW